MFIENTTIIIDDTSSIIYGGWRDDDWDKVMREKDE